MIVVIIKEYNLRKIYTTDIKKNIQGGQPNLLNYQLLMKLM